VRLLRAVTAEAIGTFALVFAGCGAVMVEAKTHQLGHVGVAISFGLVTCSGSTRSVTSAAPTSTRR
jgi:glycerol uptake facilitator-like aquaporin